MTNDEIATILAKPYAQQLLDGPEPARLAYIGLDGHPRAIPIGFWVDGDRVHVLRDGLEMSLPRDRVRTLDAAEGSASRPEPGLPAVPGR